MPLTRAQRLRKRRLEATKPEEVGGLYIYDGVGGYDFLSWEEVEECAAGTMSQPDWFTAQEYGKPNYKSDPTYEMRRKRS